MTVLALAAMPDTARCGFVMDDWALPMRLRLHHACTGTAFTPRLRAPPPQDDSMRWAYIENSRQRRWRAYRWRFPLFTN